ncbi:MAG: gliding motility-associated C-terminal domain-containing protein [Bacteroidetes bacterium]|nr:gliding motility-associated C-terminal domain-containing protein [Bacteroidota bacterium]
MRIRILVLLVYVALLEGLKAQTGPEIEVLTPNPCVPEQVSLRVINCSSCISYEWEIGAGKGYKRAGSNYSTIINDTGWFDVNVKITTSSNSTLLITKKAAFYGRPAPAIKFTVSQPVLCHGADSILVTDNTSGIKSRDWFIDGKVFYNGPKQVKIGLTPLQGYRSVYLLVRDSFNCKATILKDSVIGVWDSVKATVNSSLTGKCAPTTVNFSALLDTGKHKITSYFWKFEKGLPATSSEAAPSGIAYAKGDTLDVSLKITTNRGCTFNYKYNNLLNIGDTSILKIGISKLRLCANEPIQLSVTGGKTLSPTWNVDSVATNEGTQKGTTVTYSFKDTGNPIFRVSENFKGCISYAQFTTKVTVEGPVAVVVSESPFYCGAPKTLIFTNNSESWPGGTSWKWQLWDSKGNLVTSSTSKNFSYTTNTGENYSVQLKATGTNGCADSMYLKKASVFGHIDTNFLVNPNPACPGKAITLNPLAGGGSPSDPNKFLWTIFDKSGNKIATDNQVYGSFSLANPGDYSAKLLVYNNSNCRDSLTLKDTIHVVSPSLSISFKDSHVCLNRQLMFVASYNVKSPSAYVFWEFTNIDSAGVTLFGNRDTARFYPPKTGRYKLSAALLDTAKNACTFGIKYPGLFYASGIRVKVTPPETNGCVPLNVNLSATLVENVNYKVKNSTINYGWKIGASNFTFGTPNAWSTSVTANAEAQYWPYFKYSNASGCMDSSYAVVDSRFQASFYLDNVAHCVGQTGKIINQATPWATNYIYDADPSIIFTPSRFVATPTIRFTKPGTWKIGQIINNGSCYDTFYNWFTIYDVKADFYTPDSISYCAPRLINFVNTTNSTFYNYWKFGDGDSAVSMFNDLTGHLYLKNNSRPGFDVTLVAENYYGCRDTITKKAYLKLIGPVPDFSAENTTGCEPLRVTFKNKSYDYSRMLLDYDNGVVLDSMELGYFDYLVTNKALPNQQYFPRLLLIDTLGCSAMAECPDTINVLKGPEPKFSFTSVNFIRNTEGCAGQLLVKFTNQSKFFGRTYWDFNADGITDIKNQNTPSYLYDKPGVFYPQLVAEHVNGCKDTFVKDSLVVWAPPVANFKPNADTTCAVNPVKFTFTGSFSHPVKKYIWNFGELPVYNDTSGMASPVWKYNTPFNHNVSLQIEDIKGCKDQIVRNLYVNDTTGPKKPELAYVTVKDDKYVEFYWKQSKLGNFLQYHVLLDSLGLWPKAKFNKRGDTMFDADYSSQLSNRRFCYTMRVEDTCNQRGIAANSHCTIVLRDSAFEPFNIHLNWLGYDWWGSELDHYEIFRKTGNGNFVKLADVKPGKLSYTDSFLCDKDYCYYVEAVHKNREYRSRSNTTCKRPIYLKPDSSVKTTLVSVKDNAYPEVHWEPYYKYYRNWSYVLERSSNGMTGTFSKVNEVRGLDTIDIATNVQDRSNFYRISFKDHCGVKGEPGLISNTIWLKAEKKERNNSSLTWTPYDYWHSGVKNYGLQLKNQSGVFQDMASFSPTTTSTENIDIEKLNLDSICFRVYAVKDTITSDTSWSNEVCLVPASYIHVPTAFTPDLNDLNDVFKPVSGFLHNEIENSNTRYEFRIYNRWGQMVYMTNDPKEGWNGTCNDVFCESGLYIWKLQAVGYDGVAYRMDGTVYLLR